MKVIVTVGETFLFVEENEVFGLKAVVILKASDMEHLSGSPEDALQKVFFSIQSNLAQKRVASEHSGRLTQAEQDFLVSPDRIKEVNARTFNCLRAAEVSLLWEAYSFGLKNLLVFRNFNKKSLNEFQGFLSANLPSITNHEKFGEEIRVINELALTLPIESFSDLLVSAEFVSFRGDFENEQAIESMNIKYFLNMWGVDSTKYPLKQEANPLEVRTKLAQLQVLARRALGQWIFQRL